VGPSGVGKTTLLSLLLRFYKPNYGEIYFDKVPAYAYDVSSLRQRIGYVSQSTQLLTGTVMENLRYGTVMHKRRMLFVLQQLPAFTTSSAACLQGTTRS